MIICFLNPRNLKIFKILSSKNLGKKLSNINSAFDSNEIKE